MRVRKALLKGPLGFGAAPLGNMFRKIPDGEASATVEAAWDQGTRILVRHRSTAQGFRKAGWEKSYANTKVEPCELAIEMTENRPDAFLLAGRYTLLDHERALQRLLPAATEANVDIVIGGPYSSGILAGGSHFEYQNASPQILAKVERIKGIAQRHKIPVKAAALQFSLTHPAVAAVIPGASSVYHGRQL